MTYEAGIVVRLATEEDLPALLPMMDCFVEDQRSIGEPNQRDYLLIAARQALATGQALVVAADERELVGYLIWTAFPGAPKGEVLGAGTYVAPKYRGKGIAARMQRYALHHLFDMGYEWVTGAVALKNEPAIHLIGATGAEITGYVIRWRRPRSLQPE